MKAQVLIFTVQIACYLAMLGGTLAPGAIAGTIYVSPWGSDTGPGKGSPQYPFRTIQKGVEAASSGDTVLVLPGTYVGPVNLSKSLVLSGSGAGMTTIEAPPDFATNHAYDFPLPNFITERAIVHVGAGTIVTVRGFTIEGRMNGPDTAQGVAYSGILADQCNVSIMTNIVQNIQAISGYIKERETSGRNGRGIHVRGRGAVAIIDSNTLKEINRFHILVNANDNWALSLPTPHADVRNNTIIGKGEAYGVGQKGIWFNTGAWGTIFRNTISDLDYPIPVLEPDRSSAIVVRHGWLDPAHRRVINGNTITSRTSINNKGMYLQGIRDSVADNTISGFRWGIEVHDGHGTKVVRNLIIGGIFGVTIQTEHRPGTADSVTIGGSQSDKNTFRAQATHGFAISLSFRDPQYSIGEEFMSSVPVDATYNDFGVYTEREIQTRIWDRADTTLINGMPVDTVLFVPFYKPHMAILTIASSMPDSGVDITVRPNCMNEVSGSTPFTLTCCEGAMTLMAPPTAGGNTFQKWLKDSADFAGNTNLAIRITVDTCHTMTAVYGPGRPGAPWTYKLTDVTHTIIIPKNVTPECNGSPITDGDFIGVFYDSTGTLVCAGCEQWRSDENVVVTAFGDNTATAWREGFQAGEVFKWKIWRKTDDQTLVAHASYLAAGSLCGIVTDTSRYVNNGMSALSCLSGIITDVKEQELASTFVLWQNYPNPFNPTTVVSFQLPVASNVRLGVYDMLGREVRTLVDEGKLGGTYKVTFDGTDLSSGVYICRMIAGKHCQSHKMLLTK